MNKNNTFEPLHIKTIIFDLLEDDRRDLVFDLIDHYYSKATKLEHFDILGEISDKAEKRDTFLKCAIAVYCLSKTSNQLYSARRNLYMAYSTLNFPEKALFYIEQNLKINPDNFHDLVQKVANLSLMGYKNEAENLATNLLEKFPEKNYDLKSLFTSKMLREGKTSEGILSFLNTENKFAEKYKQFMPKIWKGTIHPGKILYIDSVGGIGDLIVNIKFFNYLKKFGMRPILFSNNNFYRDIEKVFSRHDYEICTDSRLLLNNQYWTDIMSLPAHLKLREDQLWTGPYLVPLRQEKNKLVNKKIKIGIKCSGNPFFKQDEYRKIPIEQMVDILPKEAEIYYIDKDKINFPGIIDLSNKINSWEDTLDFIDQMNCIVSSCTSLVHAAAAIGKITFVAVPIAEYYIWTTTQINGSSPWHGDNLYVARQTKLRSWKEPLEKIKVKLNTYINNLRVSIND